MVLLHLSDRHIAHILNSLTTSCIAKKILTQIVVTYAKTYKSFISDLYLHYSAIYTKIIDDTTRFSERELNTHLDHIAVFNSVYDNSAVLVVDTITLLTSNPGLFPGQGKFQGVLLDDMYSMIEEIVGQEEAVRLLPEVIDTIDGKIVTGKLTLTRE